MKKLMIAAAIVCAAAVSQAATCYWNFQTTSGQSVYDSGLEDTFTGTGYAFMITDAVTQDSVLKAALGGTSLAAIEGTKFAMDIDDGEIAKGDHSKLTTSGTGSDNQKWFLAVVDGESVFISDFKTGGETGLETGTTIKFAVEDASSTAFTGNTFSAGGWYSVPEPTSGLLLLLGVAGLALRRRRA